jgi:hypothetical protein
MYEDGKGVAADPALALYWYRKAAEQGDTAAQAKIGSAYALGKGAPRDYVQAYVWLDVAAGSGSTGVGGGLDETVLARNAMVAHLSPTQIADAKRQAAAWKARFDAP